MKAWFSRLLPIVFILALAAAGVSSALADPISVTISGSLQDELGCPGDWDPACAATYIAYDSDDDVWQGVFPMPAGSYEFKAALNDSWDENYGANAQLNGANIALNLADPTDIKFYYDHKSHWVTDNVNSVIATAVGSFQIALGCPGDWQPNCLRSWLQDIDGDGIYTFATDQIPAGSYEFKVALDEAWNVSYPASNVPFTSADGDLVTITYDSATNDVNVDVAGSPPPIEWVVTGDFQDDLPVSAACGEWNNTCPETTMEDGNADGVFRLVGDGLPAGTYAYKVVESGNWDNAHPAANVSFTADGNQMRWYFQPGPNHVADNANQCIATAVGNFQSQVGGSDWAPDNLLTMMWQDAPGSDWYVLTTTLPAGNWEYKVARDEAWTESYPDGNLIFSLGEETAVNFHYNCATNEVLHSMAGEVPSEIADLVTAPVRDLIQDEVFYFVMPDRFDNGDPSNDTELIPGDRLDHGFDPVDKGFFHGGDLAGLTSKLEYLENLGTTAIWMTPIFKNNPVQGTGTDASAGYHGYWYVDMTQFDPHFGTNTELATLITEAHNRDIKVFFDIITNHTADIVDYEEGTYNYISKADSAYRDASGVIFDDRDYLGTGTFPALDPAVSFPYTPAFNDPADASIKVPAWLNNPIYYHNRGNSGFSGENSLYGDFFGLDDMFTEHPDVVNGMVDIYKDWITNYDIDGFRIDTVKHVNLEFWQEFTPEILAHAEAVGRDEFFVFGEVFSGDPVLLSHYTNRADFPAVLDFRFQEQVRSYASVGSNSDIMRDLFADDDYFTDADSNVYALPTFIGNHDRGRFGWFLDADNGGALSDGEKLDRSELATALMFFARGVPVIYYGDEQGFVGDGGDKDARQDMMPSLVPSYNDDDLIGTTATTADANFDPTHPLYQSYSDFAAILAANQALSTGAQLHRYSQNTAGIYAFSRIDRDEQVEYIVAFNNINSDQTAAFTTDSPSTTFTEIYPGDGPSISSNAAGEVSVGVPALSFTIYRADTPLPASTSAPGLGFNTLVNGQEVVVETPILDGNAVQERIEVGVALASDKFAEVTFAVRVNGTSDYTVIGVDGNAPYRVFFSLDDVPGGFNEGDRLDFVAVVSDNNGHLNYAEVTGILAVIPAPPPPGGGSPYAVVHYLRDSGDYGDHTTADYWGLYAWGDIDEIIEWSAPKPFVGEDDYGRFAWLKLTENAGDVGVIVQNNGTKDPASDSDRFFDPGDTPEIWLRQDDPTIFTSQAAAQGFVTIHYHRDDGVYDGWGLHLWGDAIDPSEITEWPTPKPPTGFDDFGAYWDVFVQDVTLPVNFIIHNGDNKDPGPDQSFIPQEMVTAWIMSMDETIYPQQGAAQGYAALHYHRYAGDYGDYASDDFNDFWGLHTWSNTADPGWTTPRKPDFQDYFGVAFEVELDDPSLGFNYILHRGDAKDPGPDQNLNVGKWGYEVWQLEGEGPDPEVPHYVLPILVEGVPGNIDVQSAYWVDEDTILWAGAGNPNFIYSLHYAPTGGLNVTAGGVIGGSSVTLLPGPVSATVKEKFPHLAGLPGLKIDPADLPLVPEILKGQIAVSAMDVNGYLIDATGLQIPGVLDNLYTYDGDLGVNWHGGVPTISLWAPTAKSVTLHLFDDSDPATTSNTELMVLDPTSGVWSVEGNGSWKGKYYLFEVDVYVHSTGQVEHNLVTDPYSLSLATNSARSQIVDLNDAALKPAGWDELRKPELVAPEDISIYEIHMRDFSVNDDSVPEEQKGTYKAFTLDGSNGVNHLKALQEAGLSHLHLLPVFDIATINENKSEWQEADWGVLATYPPDSEEQQALITQYENLDGFNWGYDPFHYTTPEGSYSTDPDGTMRIVEFREMVQAINEDIDLRVVMDVVYNHTNSAGQAEKSVLDRIVPGYYHRLNDTGQVETSTCCQNTATEHNMMEKLMIDSLVVWARDYGIDAFRFDLMGHHSLANMMKVKAALEAVDPDIYIYGEGWNFGEVADDARFVQATQLNLGGSGIGTFSDRLRDAVRGGSPFDGGQDLIRRQGFANGLYYDPNALNANPEPAPEPASVTIAGSLQDELGCSGDWQADCAATHLAYDSDDGVWQETFTVPAGSFAYKATIDNSWDENYGANTEPNGADIALNLGAETDVKFYYSHATHWVADNVNKVIATIPGSFQDEIGCPVDWEPGCLRSWLQDPDGDGTYSFATSEIPPGSYEAKVTINESWDENYGDGGVANGANIPFSVEAGQTVLFSYDPVSHILTISYTASDQLAQLLLLTDQIRVGMAGNLADYAFTDRNGDLVTGKDVDYNGQPAGYTQDPQENISYVSKHDNQTLYDNNAYKIPLDATMADRLRVQNVGLSTVLLGQGVPFMHAGSDLLRSKSLDRDSYNSGDWFNRLDFTYQANNWGVGLPVAGKNADNWEFMTPLLADPVLKPESGDIIQSAALFQELLAIRASSDLFRLETAVEIQDRVGFHNTGPNQLPGLIVMSISDLISLDLDRYHEFIVVLVNANDETQTFTTDELIGHDLQLHGVQANSVDLLVGASSYDSATGTFVIPGRTTTVFVQRETLENLISLLEDDVQALIDNGDLAANKATVLFTFLDNALKELEKGKTKQAIKQLEQFILQVQILVDQGNLAAALGEELIQEAEIIIGQIVSDNQMMGVNMETSATLIFLPLLNP